MNKQQSHIRGAFWMVTAGFSFAIINTGLQYLGMAHHLNSSSAVLYQYGIALLAFLPFIIKAGGVKIAARSDFRWLHLLRIGVSVVGIQLWTLALVKQVPIWQGIALLMTSPLFATLGSGLLLREHVSTPRWVATVVGFFGAALILEPWSDSFAWKTLLPVGAAFFWASASLLTKFTVVRDEGGPATNVFYLLILMLPYNLLTAGVADLQVPLAVEPWVVLVVIGLLSALANWAIAKAYSMADASFLQPFDHVKLLWNVLFGYLAFHYAPPGLLWIGAGMIIGAIAFVTHFENRRNPVEVLMEKHE